jgi:hypothetical protein
VSLPARERRNILEEVLQRRPGTSTADYVGHLVAAVGIGVPRAGGRPRTARAGGLPRPAGQEARLAGADLEALLHSGMDVGLERIPPRAARANRRSAVNVVWISFERVRRGETLTRALPTLAD